MRHIRSALLVGALLSGACSSVPVGSGASGDAGVWSSQGRGSSSHASTPRPRVTGIVGITEISALDLDLGSRVGDTTDDASLSTPLIGAQFMYPVRRQRLEWGYEGGFSLGWKNDTNAYVIDTGTVLVQADNEMFLLDFSGGLYVAKTLGQRVRIYGAAGPLMQFGSVDLDLDQPINGDDSLDGSGVGLGYYARTGIDIEARPGTSWGLTLRWVDSRFDMGGSLGRMDVEAVQLGLAVTTGF